MSTVVRLTGISKSFLGVPVLRDVDLELRAGEVHALMGENGAGKSTLLKVLAGVHRPDGGTVEIDGVEHTFAGPADAQRAGIAIIHQEFTLLPHRSVAENVYLGREPVRRLRVDRRRMVRDTAALLDRIGEDGIDPTAAVASLSVAQRQVVEIVKALATDAKVLAMDEPTAALADHEVELLYDLVRRLRERGIAILYVSHRMREVFDLSDRITVLKDGAFVVCAPTAELTSEDLVRHMVGRELSALYPDRATEPGEVRLRLRDAGNARISGVNLEVRAGEIVGIAGLQGSGRSAVARAVFGVEPFTTGTLELDGVERRITSPRGAVRHGVAFVTEDRKGEGLALRQSVRDNALLVRRSALRGSRSRVGAGAKERALSGLRSARRRASAEHTTREDSVLADSRERPFNTASDLAALLESVNVVSRGEHQEVRFLSGGNQQKVVLAKWLAVNPTVLVVDEPTRGIDVGAKQAVHHLLRELAGRGVAILMISSELPELIGMSDRILVMHDGEPAGELPADASETAVMALATGHGVGEVA